jgi:hypothetical protein
LLADALRRFVRTTAAMQLAVSLIVGGTALDVRWQRDHADANTPVAIIDLERNSSAPVRYRLIEATTGHTIRSGTLPPQSFISSLSPDGSAFVYASDDESTLRIVHTRSGRDAAIARLGSRHYAADIAWSDARTMYYTVKERSNDCNDISPVALWRVRDGTAPVRIRYEAAYRLVARAEDSRAKAGIFSQIWLLGASPDGRSILIGRQGLYRISTSAHPSVVPLVLPSGSRLNGSQAAVSPDGRTVAASLYDGYLPSDLWLIDTGGAPPRRLTDGGRSFLFPLWSRDGSHIATYTEHIRVAGIFAYDSYLIDVKGRHAVRKLPTRDGAAPMAFITDGRILMTAFLSPSRRTVQLFDPRTNHTETIANAKTAFVQVGR